MNTIAIKLIKLKVIFWKPTRTAAEHWFSLKDIQKHTTLMKLNEDNIFFTQNQIYLKVTAENGMFFQLLNKPYKTKR